MKKYLSVIIAILFFTVGVAWGETAEEWLKKGNKAYDAKNYDEAISMYKKAIAINPDLAEPHANLGAVYAKKGMLDEAIAEYKKAIAINPDLAEPHVDLGIAYGKKGMLDESIAESKKVIAINPNDADAHHNLGVAYWEKGNLSLSADYFYKAGLLYLKQGNREKALRSYEDLKLTNSKELEQALFEKLYPELKQKK
jgi:tetratricopeptide (TPR) repeat protein